MRKWINCFFRLLFPHCCVICGSVLSSEKFICMDCLIGMPKTNFHLQKDNRVERLFWGQIPIERATSFLYYSKGSDFRKILYHLKYYGCKDIGEQMGRIIASVIKGSGFFKDIDIIIPVPLHKDKQKSRGYNQSEWIAKGVSQITDIPINTTSLLRVIANPTQTKKSVYGRWENVQGVFKIYPETDLSGKHILLIDDVLTTGSTLSSCAQTVSAAYNVKISILTLAMA